MRRGMTLVELLAVIVVLAIILAVAIPSISGIVEITYGNACDINLNMMKKATKNYIDFGLREPPGDEPIAISLDELRTNNMITPVVDPKDRTKTCEGYVVVRRDTSGYIYTPYIRCESDCLSEHYGEIDIDMEPPVITIAGNNPITINIGDTYIDAGATATDNIDGDLTSSIAATSTVNTGAVGTYTVTYTVSDSIGNSATQTRTVYVVDTSIPIITLLGDNPINSPYGVPYSDPGATATDSVDGDLTGRIVVESTVNPSELGTYTVTYNVSDNSGNAAITVTRTVNIVDITAPTVMFSRNGNAAYTKSSDTVVTVTDDVVLDHNSLKYLWSINSADVIATDFISSFTNNDTINTPINVSGEYYLWVLAKDTSGNTTITRSNAFKLDSESPVITILGSDNVSILYGETYTDAGATAYDTIEGDITNRIVVQSTVNVNVVGTYMVTYNVSDLAGNVAIPVSRTVNVTDDIYPTVTFSLNGNTTYAKTRSTIVTVSDNVAVNASSLKYQWTTSTTEPTEVSFTTTFTNGGSVSSTAGITGGYYLWILAKDTSGNTTITRSNVFNLDNIRPIIAINGSSTVTISQGTSYTDAGATATDNIDGNITGNISVTNNVNINAVGTYSVTYNVSDSAGNAATTVTRTVYVVDVSLPVITILGTNPVSIPLGGSYTDAGATAYDATEGDITSKIVVQSTVNVNAIGTYTVTYNVSDSSGNEAVTMIRTVNVVDVINPTVTFSPNGNTTYAKTRSTTVTVSDNVAVNTSSLEYQWTTSTTAPTEASFTTAFTNGGSISSTAGITGGYYLWILAKDTSGNTTIIRSNVFNLDNTRPVITITGSNPVSIPQGTPYTDAGATASDNIDGNITSDISVTNNVNINVIGTYTVTYNVSDSAGNTAIAAVRTVNITDGIDPTVLFSPNGNATYAKTRSTTVTVSDNVAVNASSLKYQWTTSTSAPTEVSFTTAFTNGGSISSTAGITGGYYLWILAKDTSGNTTIIRSNVFNLDNTRPVITITGSNPVNILVGSTYTDAGATATDNIDGNITGSISAVSTVNPNTVGTYTVTYNVSDSAGNAATSAVRTVNVNDTTNPVISFSPNGNSTAAQSHSSTVTVSDNVAVNTSSFKYQWTTNTSAPAEASFSTAFTNGSAIASPGGVTGNYYLWILAKDTSGNTNIDGSNAFNLDNTDPTFTYFYIGGTGNPNSVTSTSTTLYFSVSGATQMCISTTTSCSAWETYATSKAYTLTSGYGTKTLYAWFRDAALNQIGYYSDSIDYLQATHTTTYNSTASGYSYSGYNGWQVSTSTVIQGTPNSLVHTDYWGIMFFDLATIKTKFSDYSISQIVFTIYSGSTAGTTKQSFLYVGGPCPNLGGTLPDAYTISGTPYKPTAIGTYVTSPDPAGNYDPAVWTITNTTWINNLVSAGSECVFMNKYNQTSAGYYWEGAGSKTATPPRMVITWVPR